MKSYAQIAQAMYSAYRKSLQCEDAKGNIWGQPAPTWIDLEAERQDAWIEAAKQAAAELALVH
jgi:transcriptional regulator of met regulon